MRPIIEKGETTAMAANTTIHLRKITSKFMMLITILTLLLGACSSAAPTQGNFESAPGAAPAPAEMPVADRGAASSFDTYSDTSNQAAERIVIQNANLSIVVSDPSASMQNVRRMAEEMSGFVVSANLRQTVLSSGVEVPQASITVRVPAERLDEALTRIKAETTRPVIHETIDSQDVTSEYTDLQSRLRNLENTEAQLDNIMDRATRTEDVLSVHNQLVSVREQIEVIKGQIQYYEQSAALSAIGVELLANEAVQPLTIGSWQPVGVAKDAVQALINTVKFLANAAIWLLIFVLPVLLVIYVVFYLPISLVMRAWRRRRAARKVLVPPAPPAPPTPAS